MTCPVSSSAFQYVHEHIFGEESFHLFADSEDPFDELERVIKEDQPTEATVRLRCFFAIECVVYVALRAALTSADSPELAARLSAVLPFDKSHEGLTRLLSALESIEKTLRADQLEYRFMGDGQGELGSFNAKLLEKPRVILSYLIRMTRALRPGLMPNKLLAHGRAQELGEFMGRALIDTFPDAPTCLFWVRRLVNTSMENPSAWNEKMKSPA